MFDVLVAKIRNGLAADIEHGEVHGQTEHKRSWYQDLLVLIVLAVVHVGVNRMVVHRHHGKDVIVRLENGLRLRVSIAR